MADDLLTVEQFGAMVKAKYPDYAEHDDAEIGRLMLSKYPDYGERVTPFTHRGGMADVSQASPEVFQSENEKDAEGKAVVRDQPGWNDYEALPSWLRWIGEHGPAEVRKGVSDMMQGEYAKGAHRMATGGAVTAGAVLSPLIAEGLVTAPLATLGSLAGGGVGGVVGNTVGNAIGHAGGLTDDQAAVVGDIFSFTGAGAGTTAVPALSAKASKAVVSGIAKLTPAQVATVADWAKHPYATAAEHSVNALSRLARAKAAASSVAVPVEAEQAAQVSVWPPVPPPRAQGADLQLPPESPPTAVPQRQPALPVPAATAPSLPPPPAPPVVEAAPQWPTPTLGPPKTVEAMKAYLRRSGLGEEVADAIVAKLQRTGSDRLVAGETAAPSSLPVAASREELAGELARLLGTPSAAEAEAAMDAKYARGKLKTPSATLAKQMKSQKGRK